MLNCVPNLSSFYCCPIFAFIFTVFFTTGSTSTPDTRTPGFYTCISGSQIARASSSHFSLSDSPLSLIRSVSALSPTACGMILTAFCFYYAAPFPFAYSPQYLSYGSSLLSIENPTSIFPRKYNVLLTIPLRMRKAFYFSYFFPSSLIYPVRSCQTTSWFYLF